MTKENMDATRSPDKPVLPSPEDAPPPEAGITPVGADDLHAPPRTLPPGTDADLTAASMHPEPALGESDTGTSHTFSTSQPGRTRNLEEPETERGHGAVAALEHKGDHSDQVSDEAVTAHASETNQMDQFAMLWEGFPDDVKAKFHEKFGTAEKIDSEGLVKFFAEDANLSKEQVRSLLKTLAPTMSAADRNALFSKVKFAPEVEPAPEEGLVARAKAVDEYKTRFEEVMGKAPEERKEAVKQLEEDMDSDFKERFKEGAKEVLGKSLKYSTVGFGIFFLFFLYLMSWHMKGDNK